MVALALLTLLNWCATILWLAVTTWPYDSIAGAISALAVSIFWILVWGAASVLAVYGLDEDRLEREARAHGLEKRPTTSVSAE
jgi:hypothetical protein